MYGEAADIFSLAMTFWDILYPLQDKYPEANGNHFLIFESVINGKRPQLNEDLHPKLCDLLTDAWDSNPLKRPNAVRILSTLQEIQQELGVGIATCISEGLETDVVIAANGCVTEKTCTGEAIVQKMVENGFVDSTKEAIRMGNGFMCADLLHHERHTMPFRSTSDRYVFDDVLLERLLQSCDRNPSVMPLMTRIKLTTRSERSNSPAELVSVRNGRAPSHLRKSKKVSSSQWNADSNGDGCLCRRLGAGTESMSGEHRRRFRHYQKALMGQTDGNDRSIIVPMDPLQVVEGGVRVTSSSTTQITEPPLLLDDNGLTTQLLGDSAAETASYQGSSNEDSDQSDQFLEMI